MGGCLSTTSINTSFAPDPAANAKSAQLDSQLKEDEKVFKRKTKVLLLGAGEAGKSTLLKQMKLIYAGGITREERQIYRSIVRQNVILSMFAILEAMDDLGVPLRDTGNASNASIVRDRAGVAKEAEGKELSFDVALIDAVRLLWRDEGVKAVLKRYNEFQLNDSAPFFFDAIDRIGSLDYLPTDNDCLRARVQTVGVTETEFTDRGTEFVFVDVGGQRRISQFENVTGLAFLVAVSEYDLCLREDSAQNRLVESLAVFDSIIQSRFFEKTAIVLLLNKVDLLKARLPHSPAHRYWPELKRDASWKDVVSFFSAKFLKLNNLDGRQIFVHYTCSTDTELMRKLSATLIDQLARRNLDRVGLL